MPDGDYNKLLIQFETWAPLGHLNRPKTVISSNTVECDESIRNFTYRSNSHNLLLLSCIKKIMFFIKSADPLRFYFIYLFIFINIFMKNSNASAMVEYRLVCWLVFTDSCLRIPFLSRRVVL